VPIIEEKTVVRSNWDGTEYTARNEPDLERTAAKAAGTGAAIGAELTFRALRGLYRDARDRPEQFGRAGKFLLIGVPLIIGLWALSEILPGALKPLVGVAILVVVPLMVYRTRYRD
jgi:hypothetical protein